MRNKMIQAAQAWLGRNEADGSHRQIIDIYNTISPLPGGYRLSYTDPWCAAFVSAAAQVCGCTGIVFPECSCDRMIERYKAAGCWIEDDAHVPQPGEIIFYDWQDSGAGDCTGSADHVGLVADVRGNTITVIEGNKSDAVGYRYLEINSRYIRGYGVPDYDSIGTAGVAITSPAYTKPTYKYSVKLPLLKPGMEDPAIATIQEILAARGYYTGDADGIFGELTKRAVMAYQADAGLDTDGEIGGLTWKAIIKEE